MDTNRKAPHITDTINHLPPAQLWIGEHTNLVQRAQTYLQKIFCVKNNCGTCITCTQIAQQQHHAVMWLYPEKQYTREQLDTIFGTIAFALSPGQRYFFVLQKADFLTPICANSLLKPIEEPPPGYHFLLLAQRTEQILPTIRSRCVTSSFIAQTKNGPHADLFDFFTSSQFSDPSAFLKQLDQSKINERESVELLDELLNYWMKQYKKAVKEKHKQKQDKVEKTFAVLKQAAEQPPMPGSSKIFWKNLFLQMKGSP